MVAFHAAAAHEESYCAAWVTACAAKISILLALLFFFQNVRGLRHPYTHTDIHAYIQTYI